MKRKKFPVFGFMNFDGSDWTKKYYFESIGKKVHIYISNDRYEYEQEINNGHIETFKNFIDNYDNLKEVLTNEIFDYYQFECENTRDDYDLDEDELDEIAPIVDNKEEFLDLELFELKAIHVYDNNKIGLVYNCTWEEEHGMGIRLVNLEIEEIGFVDVIFH
ncbi:MAG: hypothetical protein U0354_00195 [Candidatus Sericytochromatia bacterium]